MSLQPGWATCEFKASLGHMMRPCHKRKKKPTCVEGGREGRDALHGISNAPPPHRGDDPVTAHLNITVADQSPALP